MTKAKVSVGYTLGKNKHCKVGGGGDCLSEEIQRRLAVLNVRVKNVNLALNDLLREMGELVKAYADRVAGLEKENAELKAEQEKKSNTGSKVLQKTADTHQG